MTETLRRVGGRYLLGERLGTGGMGIVYRAHDLRSGRAVAVKLLADHLIEDEAARRRFEREAEAARRLTHPNVVALLDAGEERGHPFLVMELVEGESLHARLRRGRLNEHEALVIMLQVVDALAAAHAHGVLHRDITPQNVLLTAAGVVKVTDFGIARLAGEPAVTGAGLLLGTAPYLAPERVRGETSGTAADLYAVGVILFETLAGRPPFGADPASAVRRLHARTPDLREERRGISAATAALVTRLLDMDPRRRPSAAEARTRIQAILDVAPGDRHDEGRSAEDREEAIAATDVTAILPIPTVPLPALIGPAQSRRPVWLPLAGAAGALVAGVVIAAFSYQMSRADVPQRERTSANRMIVVPDVRGLTLVEARSMLEAAGLRVGEVRPVAGPKDAKGIVTAQEPLPGGRIDAGGVVALMVGAGPPVASKTALERHRQKGKDRTKQDSRSAQAEEIREQRGNPRDW